MKKILILFFVLCGLFANSQTPTLPYKIATPTEYKELIVDSLGIPVDTFSVPSHYNMRQRPWIAAKGDSIYLWSIALQKWVLNAGGGGGGAVSSVFGRTGVVTAQSGDYSAYYVPLTRTINGYALSSNITLLKSDIGLSNVPNIDATLRGNHTGTQLASTISDFTTAGRNLLSAGSGISYNSSTGVISATGLTSVAWGDITGTLSAQTDLQTALNGKQATLSGTGIVNSVAGTISYKTGTANQLFRRNAANTDYEFFTPSYLTSETDPNVDAIIKAIPVSADATTNKYLNWNGSAYTRKQILSSELNNDAGYLTSTTIPLTSTQIAYGNGSNQMTSGDKLSWNNSGQTLTIGNGSGSDAIMIFNAGVGSPNNMIHYKSNGSLRWVAGHNGANSDRFSIARYNSSGVFQDVPFLIEFATGDILVDNLKTGGSAPTTSGTTKMVISDADGRLSFADIPGGGSSLRFGKSGEDATASENRVFDANNNDFIVDSSSSFKFNTKKTGLRFSQIDATYQVINQYSTYDSKQMAGIAISNGNNVSEVLAESQGSADASYHYASIKPDSIRFGTVGSYTANPTRTNFMIKKLPSKSSLLSTDSLALVDNNGKFFKIKNTDLGLTVNTAPQSLTDGGTVTMDWSVSPVGQVTIAGNRTLSVTNIPDGQVVVLKVKQDATGNRTLSLPGIAAFTLSTAANAENVLTGINYGGTIYWSADVWDASSINTGNFAQSRITNLVSDLASKQATLVSGTNIKTINGTSLLGSGDITISGGGATPNGNDGNIQRKNGSALLGSDNLNFASNTLSISDDGTIGSTYRLFIKNNASGAVAQFKGYSSSLGSPAFDMVDLLSGHEAIITPTSNGVAFGAYSASDIYIATNHANIASFSSAGAFSVNDLAGTGTRLPQLNANGTFTRSSVDPANLITGGSNLGGGVGVFSDVNSNNLRFNSFNSTHFSLGSNVIDLQNISTSDFASNVVDNDNTLAANSSTRLATQAAVKGYVDNTATSRFPKAPNDYATTAALAANTYNNGTSGVGATITMNSTGVLTVDGHTMALNETLLVKDESTASHNGYYTVTTAGAVGVAAVLTRRTDFDQAAEIVVGAFTFIINGSANGGKEYTQTATVTTVGTDAVTFVQTGGTTGGGSSTASNLGGGLANYDSQSGSDLRFNTFNSSDFNLGSNLLSLDYANGQAATSGQNGFLSSTDWSTFNNKIGTGSNQNSGGVGVFYQKSGVDAQFKGIASTSGLLSVADNTTNHTIDLTINQSSFALSSIGGSLNPSQINSSIGTTPLHLTGNPSTNGTIWGTSTGSQAAGYFENTSTGAAIRALAAGGEPVFVQQTTSGTTDIQNVFKAWRLSSGTAGNGLGLSYENHLQASDGSVYLASKFNTKWTNATPGSRVSNVDINVVSSGGTEVTGMNIQPDGTIRVNNNADTLAKKADIRNSAVNKGGWLEVRVSGSDATTTGQSLVDITGLTSGTVENSTLYEIDATLLVATSNVTTGTQYGIGAGGTGGAAVVNALITGTTTTNAAQSTTISAASTAAGTYLTTSSTAGVIRITGFVTTRGSGTATISLQHLKVTSGTSTVKVGSVLRIRKV